MSKTLPLLPSSPELPSGAPVDAEARLEARAGWRAGWDAWPWHALEVTSGRELLVRDALGAVGMPAVVPVAVALVKVSRHARATEPRLAPLLGGYVFAGVAPGDWARVAKVRDVRRVVGVGGEPARLRCAELRRFLRRSAAGAETPPQYWQGLSAGPRLAVGGRAEVLRGPMAGWLVDVADLRGRRAWVVTALLGGRAAEIEVDALAAA